MYRLKTSAAFDSAHFLAGYEGKCANIHGHCWKIEAEFSGAELQSEGQERGMLTDFSVIKKAVRSLADSLDHTLIYEEGTLKDKTVQALNEENFRLTPVPFRPTAENFARYFFDKLAEKKLPVTLVRVYETQDNCAEYEADR
ncbi:6-carboxytetrahydropterin synthase QueD [Ruminococcus sp.]|uniref:6-carboxytetrahydropterin synthase QueD n=1 Tax=Ruminococcus sp. TaxID=41978 RepID=UPI0025F8E01D|nr:6-carboxytetrahydropterin synthase QueD [Ruminococcus sp.]MBQ8967534.1 6-carboxytetrahydropterin synthase QueD [Ruminococcus sp.]